MRSDQELFAAGLATYEKVVSHNYNSHTEVYRLLQQILEAEAPIGLFFWILPAEPLGARPLR
jgi:hypothetical protein